MVAPVTVPIANRARLADNRLQPTSRETVAAILKRCKTSLIADWLTRAKSTCELNHLQLSDEQRTGHVPKLVDDIVERLGETTLTSKDSDAIDSFRRRRT